MSTAEVNRGDCYQSSHMLFMPYSQRLHRSERRDYSVGIVDVCVSMVMAISQVRLNVIDEFCRHWRGSLHKLRTPSATAVLHGHRIETKKVYPARQHTVQSLIAAVGQFALAS